MTTQRAGCRSSTPRQATTPSSFPLAIRVSRIAWTCSNSVIMHELGHVLGLEHSDHDDDVMFQFAGCGRAARVAGASTTWRVLGSGSSFDQTWARPKRRVRM